MIEQRGRINNLQHKTIKSKVPRVMENTDKTILSYKNDRNLSTMHGFLNYYFLLLTIIINNLRQPQHVLILISVPTT